MLIATLCETLRDRAGCGHAGVVIRYTAATQEMRISVGVQPVCDRPTVGYTIREEDILPGVPRLLDGVSLGLDQIFAEIGRTLRSRYPIQDAQDQAGRPTVDQAAFGLRSIAGPHGSAELAIRYRPNADCFEIRTASSSDDDQPRPKAELLVGRELASDPNRDALADAVFDALRRAESHEVPAA